MLLPNLDEFLLKADLHSEYRQEFRPLVFSAFGMASILKMEN